MWKPLRRPLQLVSVALIFGACTEPRTPAVQGVFALRSTDGQPLPALEGSTPSFRTMLVADTFVFDGRGHYMHRGVVEEQSPSDSLLGTQSSLGTGDYSVSADMGVEFSYSCPPGYFCSPPPRGLLQPTGDLLLVYSSGRWHESRYARVR